jgi:hypothetical protein
MRRYPEPTGPKTQTELLAWLFSSLGAAYSMLAQYEAEDDQREHERMRETLSRLRSDERIPDDVLRTPKNEGASDV